MQITANVKQYFFDRELVQKQVDKRAIRALQKYGSFVRVAARSSIRRRKRVSNPGEPPSSHSKKNPNIRTIVYAYDPANRSVVVGPMLLRRPTRAKPIGNTGPGVLEGGGILQLPKSGRRPARQVKVAARPFMGPAESAERPKAASYFQNIVK